MKKVTEQREELESVAGGYPLEKGTTEENKNLVDCHNCDYFDHLAYFSPTRVDSSCGAPTRLTCPKCGYSWVEGDG